MLTVARKSDPGGFYTVLVQPLGSLSAQPGLAGTDLPAYSQATISGFSGSVSSEAFWNLIKQIRPQYSPSTDLSSFLLMKWTDEQFDHFKQGMATSGTKWKALPGGSFKKRYEKWTFAAGDLSGDIQFSGESPATQLMITLNGASITNSTTIINGVKTDKQFKTAHALVQACADFRDVWNLFALPEGEQTMLVAFRTSMKAREKSK